MWRRIRTSASSEELTDELAAPLEAEAAQWLTRYPGHLWPDGAPPDDPNALDPRLLIDLSGGTGPERLRAQYYRANIDPSERYVLTLPG